MDEGGGRIIVCIHTDVDGIDALARCAGCGSHMSTVGRPNCMDQNQGIAMDDCAEKQITPKVILSKRSLRASF